MKAPPQRGGKRRPETTGCNPSLKPAAHAEPLFIESYISRGQKGKGKENDEKRVAKKRYSTKRAPFREGKTLSKRRQLEATGGRGNEPPRRDALFVVRKSTAIIGGTRDMSSKNTVRKKKKGKEPVTGCDPSPTKDESVSEIPKFKRLKRKKET